MKIFTSVSSKIFIALICLQKINSFFSLLKKIFHLKFGIVKNFIFINKLIIYFALTFLVCKTGISTSAELTEKIPSWTLSFRDVDSPSSPVRVTLKNNEVDISTLIPALERVKESHFDNIFKMEYISLPIISETINNLCKKSNLPKACEEKANAEVRENLDKIYQELESHILYPSGYHPINSERVVGFFEKAMNVLNSDCLGDCDDYDLIGAIRYASQEEYTQLYDKIKATDKKCQKNILSALAKKLEDEEFPKKCLQKENKKHPVCESMSKDINIIRGRVLEMAEIAYGPDILKTTEAKAFCLDCIEKFNNNSNETEFLNVFSNLVVDINEQSQCSDLNPGQEKRVHSGTGSNRSYNLKKEPDGTYSVSLNVQFIADEDYDGDVPKDQVPEHYMKRVQKCINKANEKMLGPNGEKLKIAIQKPTKQTDSNCENDVKEIKISSEDHRSNAGKYESDIDCPTITHEVLHLLGLCDEYKEPGSYDCRIDMTNSIMSNHYERWHNVFEERKNNSLLTPGQFNAILYGSCDQKNKVFNQCSKLAYQSSANKPDCSKQKQQCETQNIRGLSKEEEIKRLTEEIKSTQASKAIAERLNIKKSVEALDEKLNSLRKRLKVVQSWP